jgi:hypothetical protein
VAFAFKCSGAGSKVYEVTQGQVAEWAAAFPGVDVLAELRKSAAWQEADPAKRRKTHRGMAAHLVGWLSRTQDGGRVTRNGAAGPLRPPAATKPEDFAKEVPGGF